MTSPFRSSPLSSSPARKSMKHTESIATSVNIATAFSNSNYPSLIHDDNDFLDMRKLDHDAIRNDPELKDLSRNPSAFNSNLRNHKNYSISHRSSFEEEEDSSDFGEFDEIEKLVHDPVREQRQRKLLFQQYSTKSSTQNAPPSIKRKPSSFSYIPKENPTYSIEDDLSIKSDTQTSWKDTLQNKFYTIIKPIMFVVFMLYWIIKEPIIRSITFITIIVSNIIVDPIYYLLKIRPTPTMNEDKNNLAKRVSALLIAIMIASTVYQYDGRPSIVSNVIQSTNHHIQSYYQNIYSAFSSYELIRKQELSMIYERLNTLEQTIKNQKQANQLNQDGTANKQEFPELITNSDPQDFVDSDKLKELIDHALNRYHQDTINTADFALASRGGRILYSKTTATYELLPAWISQLRSAVGLVNQNHLPHMILTPSTNVGECWRMKGSRGNIGIGLSQRILIKSITIDHPSSEILFDNLNSAPKDLTIYGIQDYGTKSEKYVLLGKAQYNIHDKKSIQTFNFNDLQENSYHAVLVKITSNWGNPTYTDVYRIRVHGIPV